MNWKQKLEEYESKKEWKLAVQYMAQVIKDYPNDVEVWVRTIYLIWNYVVEEPVRIPDIDLQEMQNLCLHYFKISSDKFKNDPEYLFFIGILGHVAEWMFGYNDTNFATEMLHRGLKVDPNNKLLQWECELIKENIFLEKNKNSQVTTGVNQLEKEILQKNSPEVEWLLSKGALGKYILNVQLGLNGRNIKFKEEVLNRS